jgi:hypothetical protein
MSFGLTPLMLPRWTAMPLRLVGLGLLVALLPGCGPVPVPPPTTQAREHLLSGRWAEAVAACNVALSVDGRDTQALVLRGRAWLGSGHAVRALADFSSAISLAPTQAEAFYQRAVALRHLGRPSEARDDELRARELDPEVAKAYVHSLEPAVDPVARIVHDAEQSAQRQSRSRGAASAQPRFAVDEPSVEAPGPASFEPLSIPPRSKPKSARRKPPAAAQDAAPLGPSGESAVARSDLAGRPPRDEGDSPATSAEPGLPGPFPGTLGLLLETPKAAPLVPPAAGANKIPLTGQPVQVAAQSAPVSALPGAAPSGTPASNRARKLTWGAPAARPGAASAERVLRTGLTRPETTAPGPAAPASSPFARRTTGLDSRRFGQ